MFPLYSMETNLPFPGTCTCRTGRKQKQMCVLEKKGPRMQRLPHCVRDNGYSQLTDMEQADFGNTAR